MDKEDTHFFRLRIPLAVKDRVAEAARKSRRSLNGEIIYQLEKVFPDAAAGGDKA